MTPDDEMLDLFMHPGWKRFHKDMTEALDMLVKSCHSCPTSDAFFRQKGMIQQLTNVVGYADAYRQSMDAEDEDKQWHIMQ